MKIAEVNADRLLVKTKIKIGIRRRMCLFTGWTGRNKEFAEFGRRKQGAARYSAERK